MRTLTTLFTATIIGSGAVAQTPHEYLIVDSVPGVTAADLYARSKRWFIDTYKDAAEVIQLDDAANFTIVGKGNFIFKTEVFTGYATRKGYMNYTVEVSCKDGRYRLRMYDYIHRGSPSATTYGIVGPSNLGLIYDGIPCTKDYKGGAKHIENVCKKEVQPQLLEHDALIAGSLRMAMTTAAAQPSKSDW